MEIVPFAPGHLDTVVALEREIFAGRDPWNREAFARELGAEQSLWRAAIEGGDLVGYAGGWIVGDEFHLLNLGVAAAARRRGAGRALLREVLLAAAARGCGAALLDVRRENEAAIRLYEEFGFKFRCVRPAYYSNGEDSMLYSLVPLTVPRGRGLPPE